MIWCRPLKDAGFVLVNALVIVAAIAAVAALLLSRAEQGRSRLEAGQTADQLAAYLDGFDAVAITVLARDRASGAVDAASDAWANSDYAVEVDRGRIAGQITDMQGLFNLNWLADPSNTKDRAAFERLLAAISVSPSAGDAILGFFQPGGPNQIQPYLRQSPAIRPTGGRLVSFDQLEQVPTVTARDLDRLRRVATALPGPTTLNINTAPASVLGSLLPDLSGAQINTLIAARRTTPFASVLAFTQQVELMLGTAIEDVLPPDRLSVGSEWFQVDATATLGSYSGTRRTILFRQALPVGITTHWRVSTYP